MIFGGAPASCSSTAAISASSDMDKMGYKLLLTTNGLLLPTLSVDRSDYLICERIVVLTGARGFLEADCPCLF